VVRALDKAIDLLETARAAAQQDEDEDESSRMLAGTIDYNLGARLQERFELSLAAGTEDFDLLQHAADLLDLGGDRRAAGEACDLGRYVRARPMAATVATATIGVSQANALTGWTPYPVIAQSGTTGDSVTTWAQIRRGTQPYTKVTCTNTNTYETGVKVYEGSSWSRNAGLGYWTG
jgi:hypothetical protein